MSSPIPSRAVAAQTSSKPDRIDNASNLATKKAHRSPMMRFALPIVSCQPVLTRRERRRKLRACSVLVIRACRCVREGIIRERSFAIGSVALFAMAYAGASTTFTLDSHVISTGSSLRATSACFRLSSTIGEPVAGYSSSLSYSMIAGFRAKLPTAGDDIFFDGFQDCGP